MTATRTEFVEALAISLHGQRVAVLTHYTGGKNMLTFDPVYRETSDASRFTATLTQLIKTDYLSVPQVHKQRLSPILSNLLPEGALRAWMAQSLKLHPDNEFPLIAHTGGNLPGAFIATPIEIGQIPAWALSQRDQVESVQIQADRVGQTFSLAGVQMKFSGAHKDGRFRITTGADEHSWIIKTPSTIHPYVPSNEYSAMMLAKAAGVIIPEIELVPVSKLEYLPNIQLPKEEMAYAIKRFDRTESDRVHTEDFAQIFELYPHDKYNKINYEQIGSVVYRHSTQGLADLQQLARRLLVNILLANGDAHIKNWSMYYPDKINPRLAPAYDIVSTLPYMPNENSAASNLGKEKNWYKTDMLHFELWAKRIGAPWPAIIVHLKEVIEIAKEQWPELLKNLPMDERQKNVLSKHWKDLTGSLLSSAAH